MKLVLASDNDFGRMGSARKPQMPGPEFSEEVQKQELKQAEEQMKASHRKPGKMESPELTLACADSEVEDSMVTKEEECAEQVDESSLAEGQRLFGSLFCLMEEHLNANVLSQNLRTEKRVHGSGSARGGSIRADSVKTDAIDPVRGSNSVLVDLAQVRARIVANGRDHRGDAEPTAALPTQTIDSAISKPEKSTKSKDLEQLKSETVAVLDSRASVPEAQNAAGMSQINADENLALQNIGAMTGTPSPTNPTPRTDQIIRAILEKTQHPGDVRKFTNSPELRVNPTSQALRMSLHPLELGSLEISVSKRGKRLEVTVVPELAATARLLQQDAEQLVRRLGVVDVNVDQVQVRIWTADGFLETHQASDVLQFSAQQNAGSPPNDQRSSRPLQEHTKQREGSTSDDSRHTEPENSSDAQHASGAVYI